MDIPHGHAEHDRRGAEKRGLDDRRVVSSALAHCRLRGVKTYITVNTLVMMAVTSEAMQVEITSMS